MGAGRKIKIGLEYFSLDVDLFADIKIRKLIKRKGGGAVTVYVMLLCLIYKKGYYLDWDDELPFYLSEQTGFNEDYCLEVLKTCVGLELFNQKLYKREHVLTSARIQASYKWYCEQAKRIHTIDKYCLISSEEINKNSEEITNTSEETNNNSKNKGRNATKRKERKRIEESPPSLSPPSLQDGENEDEDNKTLSSNRKSTYYSIQGTLTGMVGVESQEQIQEAIRLTCKGRNDHYGVQLIKWWVALPEEERKVNRPFYTVIQTLQKLEREGRIEVMMSQMEFKVRNWLRNNLTRVEYNQVDTILTMMPSLLEKCNSLINEVEGNRFIKMPGAFISKRMYDAYHNNQNNG